MGFRGLPLVIAVAAAVAVAGVVFFLLGVTYRKKVAEKDFRKKIFCGNALTFPR